MGVGLKLKKILRDKKISIKQLSEKSGISINTLYSITKRDSVRVDDVVLQQIANTLEIPIGELLGMSDVDAFIADFDENTQVGFLIDDFKKRLLPLNEKGRKKVSDFAIDYAIDLAKIPEYQKAPPAASQEAPEGE